MSEHKGTLFSVNFSPNMASEHVKGIRLNSYQVQGPKLFNCLPMEIRNSVCNQESWKTILDKFLETIPDLPFTTDLDSGLCDKYTSSPMNSILEWIPNIARN